MPQIWVPQNGVTRRVIATIVSALMVFTLMIAVAATNSALATDADHGAAPKNNTTDLPNDGTLSLDALCTTARSDFSGGKTYYTQADFGHEPGHPSGSVTYALWANASSFPDFTTMDFSGNNSWIDGATVSREDFKFSGNNNILLHGTSWGDGDTWDLAGNDNCFMSGPVEQAPSAGFPVSFSTADYAPGSTEAGVAGALGEYYVCGFAANGTTVKQSTFCDGDDLKVGSQGITMPTGLYYIKGTAFFSGSNLDAVITVVALDSIDTSGSNDSTWRAYTAGLLFMADGGTPNSTVGEDVLKVAGGLSTFHDGHIIAPNGRVELSGNRNYFNCTVMGDRIRLNGNNIVIEGNDCKITPPPPPELTVEKTASPTSVHSTGAWVTFTVKLSNSSATEALHVTELTDWFEGSAEADLLDESTEVDLGWLRNNACDTFAGNPVSGGNPIVVPISGNYSCTFEAFVSGISTSTTYDQDTCTATEKKIDVVTGTAVGAVTQVETSDEDCEEIEIDPDPVLTIVKTANPTTIYSGDSVTYTVKLWNSSLTEDVLVDELTDNIGDKIVNLLEFGPDSPLTDNTCNNGSDIQNDGTITVPKGGEANAVTCTYTLDVTNASASYVGDGDDACETFDVVDLATASGDGVISGIAVSDNDCAGVDLDPDPTITLDKDVVTPADGTVFDSGGWVTYKVTIGNNSTTESVTLTSLTDEVDGTTYDLLVGHADLRNNTCDDGPITIAASGSENCTFELWVDGDTTSAVTENSCDADVIDVATAKGVGDTSGIETNEPDDCEEINIDPDPTLVVTKTVTSPADGSVFESGQNVFYAVKLENKSTTESITITELTDNVGGSDLDLLADEANDGVLSNTCNDSLPIVIAASGEFNCSFSIFVSGSTTSHAKVDDCQTTDAKIDLVTGVAVGDDSGVETTDDDCEEITIDPDPTITLDKDVVTPADGTVFDSGGWVTYKVTIGNNSTTESVTLTSLTDEVDGTTYDLLVGHADLRNNTCDDGPITIAASGSENCTFELWVDGDTTSAVTENSCDADVIDVATAKGVGDTSGIETNEPDDCEEINIDPDPTITIVKSVLTPADTTVDAAGENVTYKVMLTNLSTVESVKITELTDDVDGKIYDLLSLTEDADLVTNTCNDDLDIVLDKVGGQNNSFGCMFTLFVDHTTVSAAGTHDSCTPDDQIIDIATTKGVGVTSNVDTNEPSDCAEVTVDEPDASLAIDKLVWDEETSTYLDSTFLPSSTALPATVEWKITVSNPSEDLVINIVFNDVKAPACVTAFTAAMDDIETGKDWLDPAEQVTFTCEDSVDDIPYLNTAVANGDDVWDRAVPEVDDSASVLQVQASGLIGDTVWYDCSTNVATDPGCDNGVQDAGELGIAGVKVTITGLDGQDVDPDPNVVQTTRSLVTDADGKYLFSGLPDGNYKVQVLIGDVPDPDSLGRTLRFTTASSFTILLPENGSRLDADFGVIADTLPKTGLSADEILVIAMLLLVVGSVAVLATRRQDDEAGPELAA